MVLGRLSNCMTGFKINMGKKYCVYFVSLLVYSFQPFVATAASIKSLHGAGTLQSEHNCSFKKHWIAIQ